MVEWQVQVGSANVSIIQYSPFFIHPTFDFAFQPLLLYQDNMHATSGAGGINSFECQLPQHIESAHALVLATVYDGAVVETLSKPIPIVLKQFQVCFFFT